MRVAIMYEDGSYGGLFDNVYAIEEVADLQPNTTAVLFTGGADVHPHDKRTSMEVELAGYCQAVGIPMLGICRGMQFLAWWQGVPLIQHIDNHTNTTHQMVDWRGRYINVKGDHHQAIDAVKEDGSVYKQVDILSQSLDGIIEACFFPEIKGLGVQYHPEWMSKDSKGYKWWNARVGELLNAI